MAKLTSLKLIQMIFTYIKQLLNLDIPKHQQNEIIDLLSPIIEIL